MGAVVTIVAKRFCSIPIQNGTIFPKKMPAFKKSNE
jgi:hypothetical protein